MPATAQKNYYDLLGVPKDAPKDVIRKAYLALAKKCHPDKTGGDKAAEERLKEINAAYDVLKNEEKRKQYDATLDNPFAGAAGFSGGPNAAEGFGPGGFSFSFEGGGLGDILEGLLGGAFAGAGPARSRSAVQPGRDLEIVLDVSLREAASGVTKKVRIHRESACGTCHGAGHVNRTPCAACGGQGRVRQPRTVKVTIPAGVHTGTRLRLPGQGEASLHGAPPGDLYVKVHVAHDPVFKRDGDHLHCEAPVRFTTAALGGTVRVPTLAGQASLKIPEGTQSGKVFRLRGQGMPTQHGGKGDLLVTVQITVPTSLTTQQRDLLTELDTFA
jgi:molecular chaperone DnaJ